MDKLRVAVIGAGFIARVHIPSWKRIPGVELVSVVDIVEDKAKGYAEEFKIPAYYKDFREMLEKEDVDIVDICTPTYTHAEIAIESMKAGKHVLTEKPIALKTKDAREMIETAKKQGVKFMVAHCLRFWPEYVVIKRIVENGDIGEPRVARAYRQSGFPVWAPWHFDENKGGGVFVDMSIHDVDTLRWIIGDVEEVYARGGVLKEKKSTAYDYVHALLKFKNGAIAYVEGSWIQPEGYPFSTYMEIVGTKGALRVDNHETAAVKIWRPGQLPQDFTPNSEDAYYLEIKNFYEAVKYDKEPAVPGEEGLKTLEVVLAAVKSIREGKPVKLPLSEEVFA